MSDEKRNDNFTLEDILNDDYGSTGDFSLESILAEYKGNAFMEGERKTPPDELDKKVSEIFREITGRDPSAGYVSREAEKTPTPAKDDTDAMLAELFSGKKEASKREAEPKADSGKITDISDFFSTKKEPEKPAPVEEVSAREPEAPAEPGTDKEDDFFKNFSMPTYDDTDTKYFESKEFQEKVASQVDRPDNWSASDMELGYDEEDDEDNEEEERPSLFSRRFRKRDAEPDEEDEDERAEMDDDVFDDDEDDDYYEEEEPDVSEEIQRFSAPIRPLTLRIAAAGVLSILILILTHLFEADKALPFGIGYNTIAAGGAVLLIQLVVMMLGIDVLISGAENLFRAEPNTDSLVLISCAVTVIDGMRMLITRNFDAGLPFSLVSSFSLVFAMLAKRDGYISMLESLKMSLASSSPYGVITELEKEPERMILKKVPGRTEGFYKKLVAEDVGEQVYYYATPIIIVVSFVFALLASVGRGRGGDFAHTYSIVAAVAAAFPAASVFVLPFRYAVTRIKKAGCAIAGWNGACEIFDADCAIITDEDVFPVGSVSLSGIKFFEGVNNQKALVDACSLLGKADTGISRIFVELLRSQGLFSKDVESFSTYEGGGVGGVIDGERVLAGSGAFMNLMGIRVPEKVNAANTVFAAINGELAAVFTLNYVPSNSVRSALQSLLNTKINILLAVKDFNVTPNVISQKFRVSMEGVEYIPVETSYRLSSDEGEKEVSAILCREGLAPLSEVITKGRAVKQITEINTMISIGGTAVGMLLMFFLCWTGSFTSASAENAFIFMTAVEICVLLLSQLVKRKA